MEEWRNALADYNRLGAEAIDLGAPHAETSGELARATPLAEALRQLQTKAEILDVRKSEPTQLVQHVPSESLGDRVSQLQDELANKRRALASQLALESVTPELEQVSESLQKRLDEFGEVPVPLERQEEALHELEEQKRRMETLLEKIPQGPEGEELRQRSEWNLNSLRDLLNRLADAVGDKVKAIAAFLASKKEAESQLAQLRDQLKTIQEDQEQTPQGLSVKLDELAGEEARLARLKAQLEEEHRPEQLDPEKQEELHQLLNSIELANEELGRTREMLKERQNAAIALEKLNSEIARVNNELASLTEQGQRTLNDAAVIPQTYALLASRLQEAINAALNLLTESTPDAHIIALQETVSEAQPVHNALQTRANLWEQFVNERDNANIQLDSARRPLDEVEAKGGTLRPLDEAQGDLEKLVSAEEQLIPLDSTLETLQRLSEQLDPLETAYADVRFFDVDLEQTRDQYEDQLTALRNEIDEENGLNEATRQVQDELARLKREGDLNRGVLGQLLEHELPALLAQSELLLDRDTAARQERRIVQRPETAELAQVNNQLKEFADQIQLEMKEKELAEQRQLLEAARTQVDLLKTQPPSEEAIERLSVHLEQLPKDHPEVQLLQREVAQVRANKDARDALRRRLQDELDQVGAQLKQIHETTKPGEKAPRKKKGKKQPSTAAAPELTEAQRKERIHLLTSAIDQLDNQLVPKLAQIEKEANEGQVEVDQLPQHQANASALVDRLAV